jgi:hypothetical protein
MVLEMFYGPRQPTVEDVGERTSLESLRLHAVNYLEAVKNARTHDYDIAQRAMAKAEEKLEKLLEELKP